MTSISPMISLADVGFFILGWSNSWRFPEIIIAFLTGPTSMIELYTSPTPNGYKVSIMLEELALDYTVHGIDLVKQEQKAPEFLAMNPNGRIPVIVDHDNDDFVVFENLCGKGKVLAVVRERNDKVVVADVVSFICCHVFWIVDRRNAVACRTALHELVERHGLLRCIVKAKRLGENVYVERALCNGTADKKQCPHYEQ